MHVQEVFTPGREHWDDSFEILEDELSSEKPGFCITTEAVLRQAIVDKKVVIRQPLNIIVSRSSLTVGSPLS